MAGEAVIAARDLPDGTQVEYDGEVFTAFPESENAGTRFRWHSDTTLAGDRSMDTWLDGGAKVIGCDEQAVANYRATMTGQGR